MEGGAPLRLIIEAALPQIALLSRGRLGDQNQQSPQRVVAPGMAKWACPG